MIDVVVVGAGPSGLSAALCLARVGRQLLVLEGGPWANVSSDTVHNFFTRDGATPAQLREAALAQLGRYPSRESRPPRSGGLGPFGGRCLIGC